MLARRPATSRQTAAGDPLGIRFMPVRRPSPRCLVLFLSLAACAPGDDRPQAPPTLRIGVLAPLTGPGATSSGTAMSEGARLAVDEANRSGGILVHGRRVPVSLVIEDTHGTEQGAASATLELINHDSVAAVVGPGVSVLAIRVSAMTDRARVPMVTPSATHPEVTRNRPFSFRISLVDSAEGVVLAHFAARALQARRMAVLFDVANPYNRSLASTVREQFTRAGGQVVAYETYTTDAAQDFGAQLRRIVQAGPEVLLLPNYTADARRQMRQARELGFRGVFLGADAWENEAGIERDPDAEGAYFPRKWVPEALGQATAGFRARYRSAYGRDPDMIAASTFDAVGVILQAMRTHGASADSLRAGLAAIRDYPGATGLISYPGAGDPHKGLVIARIRGGRSEVFWSLAPESVAALVAGGALPAGVALPRAVP